MMMSHRSDAVGIRHKSLQAIRMKILSALGLGLFLIILKSLMPDVFSGLGDALVAFFHSAEGAFNHLDFSSTTLPAAVLDTAR